MYSVSGLGWGRSLHLAQRYMAFAKPSGGQVIVPAMTELTQGLRWRARPLGMRQGAALGCLLLGAIGCNPLRFFECKDEMKSSQAVLLSMDDQDQKSVERALSAVRTAVTACDGVAPEKEATKMKDAVTQLERQLAGLRAQKPTKRETLSEAHLAELARNGDPDCPQGQKYEHPQNKQMVRCTGPQLIEMTTQDVQRHFVDAGGFSKRVEGNTLHLERGSEVYEFSYDSPASTARPLCVTVVGLRGISWQELVARSTGVQPRRLKLGQPVPWKGGDLPLLVEGDDHQFTVKLGQCTPTAGQKPYVLSLIHI